MSMEAWTRQEHAKREALEAELAATHEPAAKAAVHARLSDVLKDLYYNHDYGDGLAQALTHAKAAVTLAPDEARYWVRRGRREADDEVAIGCFTQAIALGGDDDNAYKERGYAFKNLGFKQAALEDFTRAGEGADGYGSPADEAAKLQAALTQAATRGQPGHADALAVRRHILVMAAERGLSPVNALEQTVAARGHAPAGLVIAALLVIAILAALLVR